MRSAKVYATPCAGHDAASLGEEARRRYLPVVPSPTLYSALSWTPDLPDSWSVYPPCTSLMRFWRFLRIERNLESITYAASEGLRASNPSFRTKLSAPTFR